MDARQTGEAPQATRTEVQENGGTLKLPKNNSMQPQISVSDEASLPINEEKVEKECKNEANLSNIERNPLVLRIKGSKNETTLKLLDKVGGVGFRPICLGFPGKSKNPKLLSRQDPKQNPHEMARQFRATVRFMLAHPNIFKPGNGSGICFFLNETEEGMEKCDQFFTLIAEDLKKIANHETLSKLVTSIPKYEKEGIKLIDWREVNKELWKNAKHDYGKFRKDEKHAKGVDKNLTGDIDRFVSNETVKNNWSKQDEALKNFIEYSKKRVTREAAAVLSLMALDDHEEEELVIPGLLLTDESLPKVMKQFMEDAVYAQLLKRIPKSIIPTAPAFIDSEVKAEDDIFAQITLPKKKPKFSNTMKHNWENHSNLTVVSQTKDEISGAESESDKDLNEKSEGNESGSLGLSESDGEEINGEEIVWVDDYSEPAEQPTPREKVGEERSEEYHMLQPESVENYMVLLKSFCDWSSSKYDDPKSAGAFAGTAFASYMATREANREKEIKQQPKETSCPPLKAPGNNGIFSGPEVVGGRKRGLEKDTNTNSVSPSTSPPKTQDSLLLANTIHKKSKPSLSPKSSSRNLLKDLPTNRQVVVGGRTS